MVQLNQWLNRSKKQISPLQTRNLPMTMPRAYQEGTSNFYGFDFEVNTSTLIPRPETEQLVERTLELTKKYLSDHPRILDIGTGSGVIAITLKKLLPNSVVEATDISVRALETARANAKGNQANVTFHAGNLFEPIEGRFDLIIANLPYVPAARWRFLENQVWGFEPKDAIVSGRDGLKLIRVFCEEVGTHINQPGVVALEIDDTHGPRVLKLLQKALPNHQCFVEKDLTGRDRFCFAIVRANQESV
ncbi:MAG: peptide chain release factor N(5)-glutamine methyltransferase [Candidatus Berkelbacteria bacterium]|nr:peptide chain release factor N(5)-glutamine methyltransferase [Candidatus Berkelbacteria bacterium]MCR4307735.1 peptide chain release factor N(5)-glutamine methyltransferase [Candidatus Berkelbacteria bacterium]